MKYVKRGNSIMMEMTTINSVIREFHCIANRIEPMDGISLDANEETTISLIRQKFDVGEGKYVIDESNNEPVTIEVWGSTQDIPITNGVADVLFSSSQEGDHVIKTKCSDCENIEVVITVG